MASIPNSLGIDGPNRSASRTPTARPSFARPTARLQATVDLPDAALAGGDRDDVLDAGKRFARSAVPARRRIGLMAVRCGTRRRRRAPDFGRQGHHRAGDAGNRPDRGLGPGAHRLHRLRPRRIDGDGDEDLAVANGHAGDRARIRAATRARRGREPPPTPPSPRRETPFGVPSRWPAYDQSVRRGGLR